MRVVGFLVVVLLVGISIFIFLIVKRKKHDKIHPIISENYSCADGTFEAFGKKNHFTIKKNNKIEYLVKDGQIVACRDITKSPDFVYYGGEKNGIH